MGRFDALTQLDKKIEKTPPPPGVSSPESTQPGENIDGASMEAYQHGSVEAQKHASIPAPALPKQEKSLHHASALPSQKKPKKLGSWLYEESQRNLAVIAAKRGCKQWEVLQEAVDLYLHTTKQ